jgi:hypothetical protein
MIKTKSLIKSIFFILVVCVSVSSFSFVANAQEDTFDWKEGVQLGGDELIIQTGSLVISHYLSYSNGFSIKILDESRKTPLDELQKIVESAWGKPFKTEDLYFFREEEAGCRLVCYDLSQQDATNKLKKVVSENKYRKDIETIYWKDTY